MYQKTTLDNGLRIVTSEMPHTRSVSILIFIGTGSRYESENEAGISHFVEHLLFKGTPKRPTSRDIAEAIEGIGGIINAGTDKELTLYWCKIATPQLSVALDVLADILFNSKFDPVEIERERQVIIEEINMCKDAPQSRVNTLIDEIMWAGHPLGRDVAGNRKSVTAISRDMMMNYIKRHYLPRNTVVAIAGNIEHARIVEQVNQAMDKWSSAPSDMPGFTACAKPSDQRLCLEKKDTEQSHLCLALPGVSVTDPRRFPLDLLNIILGEGMSSRLFTEVRDKLGLTYSIGSYVEHYLDCGSLIVSAAAEPRNLSALVQAIVKELTKLKEPVPPAELARAKEQSKGHLLLRMEDTRSVAGWIGGQEVLTGRIFSVDEVVSQVDAITAEEIKKLAEEFFRGEQLHLAVVGPNDKIETLEEQLVL